MAKTLTKKPINTQELETATRVMPNGDIVTYSLSEVIKSGDQHIGVGRYGERYGSIYTSDSDETNVISNFKKVVSVQRMKHLLGMIGYPSGICVFYGDGMLEKGDTIICVKSDGHAHVGIMNKWDAFFHHSLTTEYWKKVLSIYTPPKL